MRRARMFGARRHTHASGALGAVLLAALLGDASADFASADLPHPHSGKLTPYEIGKPSIRLSAEDEAQLAAGQALMQAIVQEDGETRRLLMVKDVRAPPDVITSRILDLDAYPRMVKGCDRTATYETSETAHGRAKLQTIKTRYDIHAMHMKFTYFMVHYYDPTARCMTFHLDYARRSDLDDSVGYWYVEPTGQEQCRVYYSCVTKLRTWVPSPVYALLTKVALKQATTWVDTESLKEWQRVKERQLSSGGAAKLARDMRENVARAQKRLDAVTGRWAERWERHSPPWAGRLRPERPSAPLDQQSDGEGELMGSEASEVRHAVRRHREPLATAVQGVWPRQRRVVH